MMFINAGDHETDMLFCEEILDYNGPELMVHKTMTEGEK